jgi:hypothetical protein
MNYGKFFKLNNKKSDLSCGITCYDYIWLHDDKGSQEFPIYVTIGKDSIDFHAHYHDDYETFNGEHKYKHSHNTILSLPLSANLDVKDGLTGALVEGYKTNFPRHEPEGSSYLWELHWKTFRKNGMEKCGKDGKFKELDMSYFELDTFVDKEKNEMTWKDLMEEAHKEARTFIDEDGYIEAKEKDTNSKKIHRFIRKLILDFLFDLEHTKVFQTSSHYEHISVKLKENFFFSALISKANFYYWREMILKIKKYEDKQHSAYIEYYLKAEREWTKCIRSPKAPINFNDFKDKWFDDPEKEIDKVYGKDLKKIDKIIKSYKNKQQKEDTKKSRKLSSKWLAWHYAWKWCQWKKLRFWENEFFGAHLFFPKLAASILTAWVTIIIGSDLLPAMLNKDDVAANANAKTSTDLFEILETDKDSTYYILKIDKDSIAVENGAFFRIANINDYRLVTFIVLVIIVIQILTCYSIISRRKNNKYKSKALKYFWFIIIRPFKISLISFIFSMLFGSFLASMFSSSVPIEFSLCLYLQNPFFMSCVFLAMFIGIILRLATDEKYTEE